jgi:phage terminase large subunit GpA-like protein
MLALPAEAPNSMRVPNHLPAAYFEGLAAESLGVSYKKGYQKLEWTKNPSIANEPLDTAVLCLAMLSTIKTPPPTANPSAPKPSIAALAARLNSAA